MMCEVCAVFGVSEHWVDNSDALGVPDVAAGIIENRRIRSQRLHLLRHILQPFGLTVSDWDGSAYNIEDGQGRSQLAENLSALWRVAEQLAQQPIDPLDARFLRWIAA